MIHRVNNRVLLLLFLLIFSITFIGSWSWISHNYATGDSYVSIGIIFILICSYIFVRYKKHQALQGEEKQIEEKIE